MMAGRTPVVVAANKTGRLYILDRDTGRPVFPVVEKPVPISDVSGEDSSPTQPVSVGLPELAPESLAVEEAFGTDARGSKGVPKAASPPRAAIPLFVAAFVEGA